MPALGGSRCSECKVGHSAPGATNGSWALRRHGDDRSARRDLVQLVRKLGIGKLRPPRLTNCLLARPPVTDVEADQDFRVLSWARRPLVMKISGQTDAEAIKCEHQFEWQTRDGLSLWKRPTWKRDAVLKAACNVTTVIKLKRDRFAA